MLQIFFLQIFHDDLNVYLIFKVNLNIYVTFQHNILNIYFSIIILHNLYFNYYAYHDRSVPRNYKITKIKIIF